VPPRACSSSNSAGTPAPLSSGLVWPWPLALVGWTCGDSACFGRPPACPALGSRLSPGLGLDQPALACFTKRPPTAPLPHPAVSGGADLRPRVELAAGQAAALGPVLALHAVLAAKPRREERGLIASIPRYASYRAEPPRFYPGRPWARLAPIEPISSSLAAAGRLQKSHQQPHLVRGWRQLGTSST